jgi:hypothetical protein
MRRDPRLRDGAPHKETIMNKGLMGICLLLMFYGGALAQAIECGYIATPCETYAAADAVFVARVVRVVPETIEIWQRDKDYDQLVRLAIEKTYKGIKRKSVVLHQLGRNIAPKFVLGSHYLFYANFDRATKEWAVKPCGRTQMVTYAQDDLHYLDGLPAYANKTRIAGGVVSYEPSEENPQTTRRLPGIKIRIIGNEREYGAVTDANGVYEVYDLPIGTYLLQPDIPSGLMLMGVMHYGPLNPSQFRSLNIELKKGGCAGATIILTIDRTIEKPKR